MKLSSALLKTLIRFLQDHPGIAESIARTVVGLRPELQAHLGGDSPLPPAALEKIAQMKAELDGLQADLDQIRKADAELAQLARATEVVYRNGHAKQEASP
jgi:hypothetical protein